MLEAQSERDGGKVVGETGNEREARGKKGRRRLGSGGIPVLVEH